MHFCNFKCKSEYQRLAKPVSCEWLHEQYIVNGLDTTQIGLIVNRDQKSVWRWLKDFKIPTRGRGYAAPKKFVKGQRSAFAGMKHTDAARKLFSEVAKRTGRVPYDPAVGSYMKGRRGADTPNWKGGVTPERAAFYGNKEWKAASKNVKRRDRYTCQRCSKKKQTGSRYEFDIHHIVPFTCVALRCTESNLVYVCQTCHYWIHGTENVNKEFILGGHR